MVLPFYLLPAGPEQAQELTGPNTIPAQCDPGGTGPFGAPAQPLCPHTGIIPQTAAHPLPLPAGFIPKVFPEL